MKCPCACFDTDPAQRALTPDEKDRIGATSWLSYARICSGCGCVHSPDRHGRTLIHGRMIETERGPEWIAAARPG